MDLRKSFSKPFKKLKGKLLEDRRKRDGRSGSEDGREGKEADIKRDEVNRRGSYLRSDVSIEGVVGSGPSGEGSNVGGREVALIDVDPPTSTPSISHIGGPGSM